VRQLTAFGSNAALGLCAMFATSGCFLVEDYRVTAQEDGQRVVTPALTHPATNSSVNPSAALSSGTPAATAPDAEDAGVEVQADASTVITDPSVANLLPTESASAATEPSSSVEVLPTPTEVVPPATSAPASVEVPDAGPPPAASSSAPPNCVDGSTYDATLQACVETCEADEVQGPNGRCYWFSTNSTPWSAVADMCTGRGTGWNILSVRDTQEHTFVVGKLSGDTWLGASRNRTANSWYWLDSDTDFWTGGELGHTVNDAFYTWGDGEPSQANDENCLRYHTGKWSDTACTNSNGQPPLFFVACKGPGPGEPMGPASSASPGNTWGQPGGSSTWGGGR
jgi:Lectin C-type domain